MAQKGLSDKLWNVTKTLWLSQFALLVCLVAGYIRDSRARRLRARCGSRRRLREHFQVDELQALVRGQVARALLGLARQGDPAGEGAGMRKSADRQPLNTGEDNQPYAMSNSTAAQGRGGALGTGPARARSPGPKRGGRRAASAWATAWARAAGSPSPAPGTWGTWEKVQRETSDESM